MYLPRNRAARDRFLSGRRDMSWPQVDVEQALPVMRQLGLFGEAANYIVNREGLIIGRNLYGADLLFFLERHLNPAPESK